MRTKFKAWAEPYINEHPEVLCSNDEIKNSFNFVLEIGSGKGDFIVSMAQKYPNTKFIGVEKNVTCSGFACKKLVESQIKNAKLIWNDISNVFEFINDNSVTNLFLNFSDPWPKKRHYKRRLTSINFLNEYKRILSKDGLIIFKTDNTDLFNYSIEMFIENGFQIIEQTNDYDGQDLFDAQTEYETFFRNEGTKINRVKVKYEK